MPDRVASPMSHPPPPPPHSERTEGYQETDPAGPISLARQPQFQIHRFHPGIQVCRWPLRPAGCECDNADNNGSDKLGSRSSNQISVDFLKGTGRIVYTDPDVTRGTSIAWIWYSHAAPPHEVMKKLQKNYSKDCKENWWTGEEKAEEDRRDGSGSIFILKFSIFVPPVWSLWEECENPTMI